MDVFRERLGKHGMVGFDRKDGIDCVRIVSWANGETKFVEFTVDAMPQLAKLILHAYDNKTRPDEESCFAFPQLEESPDAQ